MPIIRVEQITSTAAAQLEQIRKTTKQVNTTRLTAVGLLLVGLVLAVRHAITRQGVVDAVAVSALKLIDDIARRVEGCEPHQIEMRKKKKQL